MWNVSSKCEVAQQYTGSQYWMIDVAFSPDGTKIVSLCDSIQVCIKMLKLGVIVVLYSHEYFEMYIFTTNYLLKQMSWVVCRSYQTILKY